MREGTGVGFLVVGPGLVGLTLKLGTEDGLELGIDVGPILGRREGTEEG